MKKFLAVFTAVMLCLSATACSSAEQATSSKSEAQTSSSSASSSAPSENITENTDVDVDFDGEAFFSADGSVIPHTHDESGETIEVTKMGGEDVGYVSLPKGWKSKKYEGYNFIQLLSESEKCVITLDYFNEDNIIASDVANAADYVAYSLQSLGLVNMKGAKVKLGDYIVYQIYGEYKTSEEVENIDGAFGGWVFKDENGVIRYISCEGDISEFATAAAYVEHSFSTK